MKRVNIRKSLPFVVIVIVAITAITVTYYSQHEQVVKQINQQNTLSKDNTKLTNEKSALTQQLNHANQSINTLTQTSTFVSGKPCQTQQLILSLEGHAVGAAGNRYQAFSYQNNAKTTCTLQGAPGFLSLDSKGYVIPDGPISTAKLGNSEGSLITISPQEKAYFVLHWPADGVYPNEKCIDTSLIESTPPGNNLPLVISAHLISVCSPGIDISYIGTLNDYSVYIN